MKIDCVHKAFTTVSGIKNIYILKLLVFIIIQRLLLGNITAREGIVNY